MAKRATKSKKPPSKKKQTRQRKKKGPVVHDRLLYSAVYIDGHTGEFKVVQDKKHSELIEILDLVHPADRCIFQAKPLKLDELAAHEEEKEARLLLSFQELGKE